MGHSVTNFESEALSAVLPSLQGAIDRASEAAHGIRPWGDETEGIAGATFGLASYRLGAGDCVEGLRTMAVAVLADAGPEPPASEARLLHDADVAAIDAAFDAWVRRGPEDDRAIGDLARAIGEAMARSPGLSLMAVRAGGAVARNAGVALVDEETGEALWLFGRAVRMSTQGR